jgi:curved DNA-binding protein CbpA
VHERDYYALLGIDRRASAAEIDRAYRRAARATHPDVHPDDASAAERFNAVTVAYETLGNPERRASYDRTRPTVRAVDPVDLAGHRAYAMSVPPVRLGRRRVPWPEPSPPFHPGFAPRLAPVADDLAGVVTILARLLRSSRPIP